MAHWRGVKTIGDARVIHISAAVSYREKGSGVATLWPSKVPDWFEFGRSLVTQNRLSKNCNVAILRQPLFCLS